MNQVYFGTIESYTDLGLMLSEVETGTPEPKRTVIEVPGMNGVLDPTRHIYQDIFYQNRNIRLTFAMANYQNKWMELFSGITSKIHGRYFQVRIEPDQDYYWDAFCTVDTEKSDKNKGIVVVSLDAFPFKRKMEETSYDVIASSVGRSQICMNSRMKVVPSFYASDSGISVSFGDVVHELTAAVEMTFPDIMFAEGENEILVTGTAGTVTVTYREGSL